MIEVVRSSNRISIEFPAELKNIDLVVDEIRTFLPPCGLMEHGFDILLITREALTNAVLHGCRCNARLKVRCSVRFLKNILTIEVQDQGDGFDWKTALASELEPDPHKEHGRGLFILKRYSRTVDYNDKGNQVTLSWRCNARPDPTLGGKDAAR